MSKPTPESIGRELEPVWLNQLQATFRENTPSSVYLSVRSTVSINYVTGEEAAAAPPSDARDAYFDNPMNFMRSLIEQGVLAESVLDAFPSTAVDIKHKPHDLRTDAKRLIIRAADVADPFYAEGFRIRGEKEAVRRSLGLPSTFYQALAPGELKRPPSSNMEVGLIQGEFRDLSKQDFNAFRDNVDRSLSLWSLGILERF